MSITVALDHAVDRKAGEDRAETVARGGKTGRQSAPVRKPAHHQTYDSDVDNAGPKTADHTVCEVQGPDVIDVTG